LRRDRLDSRQRCPDSGISHFLGQVFFALWSPPISLRSFISISSPVQIYLKLTLVALPPSPPFPLTQIKTLSVPISKIENPQTQERLPREQSTEQRAAEPPSESAQENNSSNMWSKDSQK
jgi:hypothetical protein